MATPRSSLDKRLSFAGMAVLSLIWGYNWVVMKVALAYSQPFTFAALRTVLSALMMLVLLPALRRPLRPVSLGLTFLIGLLQTTGFTGLAMWALVSGGAAKVSVLVYTMPFWLLLLAWITLGERLRGHEWTAVALALAGFVLILSPWHLQGAVSTILAVGAGLSWAGSAALVKLLQRSHHVDLLSLTAWQTALGSLPLLLIAALTWHGAPVWSGTFISALGFNVVLVNSLGWLLWLAFLRSLPAGIAGVSTLAIPVIGVLAAWIQLGERPTVSEAAGILFIFTALSLMTVREARGSIHTDEPTGSRRPSAAHFCLNAEPGCERIRRSGSMRR